MDNVVHDEETEIQQELSEKDDEETNVRPELPQDAVSETIEGFGNEVGHIQQQQPSVDLSKAAKEDNSGEGEKTEVICIDVDAENDDFQVLYNYLNLNFIYYNVVN
jgi:hypothetical protein